MLNLKRKLILAAALGSPLVGISIAMALNMPPLLAEKQVEICMGGGPENCFMSDRENGCDGWCPNPPAAPTCTAQGALAFNPTTDYIAVYPRGRASFVTPKRKWNIASEKFDKMVVKMTEKYAKADRQDRKVQQMAIADWAAFKKTDDGVVSEAKLAKLSKTTRLKIRKMDK